MWKVSYIHRNDYRQGVYTLMSCNMHTNQLGTQWHSQPTVTLMPGHSFFTHNVTTYLNAEPIFMRAQKIMHIQYNLLDSAHVITYTQLDTTHWCLLKLISLHQPKSCDHVVQSNWMIHFTIHQQKNWLVLKNHLQLTVHHHLVAG